MIRKSFYQINLSKVIKNFTPDWFTLNMGTGIVFVVINNIHKNLFIYQHEISKIFWIMDSIFFVLFSILFLSRIILFTNTIKNILLHPVQSMFLGAIPIALVSISEGFLAFKVSFLGFSPFEISFYLWIIDVVFAITVALVVPFFMFTTKDKHSLESMTALWLMPIVPPGAAALAGGVLSKYFIGDNASLFLTINYLLWMLTTPLVFSILAIFILRLTSHKLPDKTMAATSWLSLGSLSIASLGILLLGESAKIVFSGLMGNFLYKFSYITGLLIWAYCFWWYAISWLMTLKYFKEGLPFSMGWWAFTFPIGVFAAATLQLWHLNHYEIFKIAGFLFTVQLMIFWVIVFMKTIPGILSGELFYTHNIFPKKIK